MQFPQIQGYLLSADYQKLIPLQQQLKALINQYNIQADPRAREAIIECVYQHQKLRLSPQLAAYLSEILMRQSQFSCRSATPVAGSAGAQQLYAQLDYLLEIQRSLFVPSTPIFSAYVESAKLSKDKSAVCRAQQARQLNEKYAQEIKDGISNALKSLQFKTYNALQLKLDTDCLNEAYEAKLKSIGAKTQQIAQGLANHGCRQADAFRSKALQLQQRMDYGIRKYAELQQEIDRCREQNGQANPREEDLLDQLKNMAQQAKENEQEYENRVVQLKERLQGLEQQVRQTSPKKDVRKTRDKLKQDLAQLNDQIEQKKRDPGK